MRSLVPVGLVGVYVVLLGIATFLEKPAMKSLNVLQINALTGVGIAVVAIVAFLVHDPKMPNASPTAVGLGIGALIGIGTIFYFYGLAKLPVSVAATIANAYVLVTIALAIIVLHDQMTLPKVLGIILTIAGVTLLASQG
ncbi:MAG: EamA family transporter [Chloroflexota bacterium]|nr:EamA family transporter [Chloroflexota bacterium]